MSIDTVLYIKQLKIVEKFHAAAITASKQTDGNISDTHEKSKIKVV